jgi:hypothetical protein
MIPNNSCRWCSSSLNDGYDHRLCKAWVIFRIRQYIDKLEDYTMLLENLVDELETEPA